MNQSNSDREQRGNVKPLIAISLAVITTLYLLTGNLPAGSQAGSTVSPADRDAVARALSRDTERPLQIEHLIVVAPRLSIPELSVESPVIEVAVAATPPRIEPDPVRRDPS